MILSSLIVLELNFLESNFDKSLFHHQDSCWIFNKLNQIFIRSLTNHWITCSICYLQTYFSLSTDVRVSFFFSSPDLASLYASFFVFVIHYTKPFRSVNNILPRDKSFATFLVYFYWKKNTRIFLLLSLNFITVRKN